MLISLDIQDNKAKVFLEFLNSLDFVRIKSELSDSDTENLISERLEEYKNNPDSSVDLKDALQSLKVKYGF